MGRKTVTEDQDLGQLFIKQLIRRVYQELNESLLERERAGEQPIFEVSSLLVEVNFVAIQTKEISGGVDFKIVTVGGGGAYERQHVHKVVLTLDAIGEPQSGVRDLEYPEGPTRFRPREE